MELFWVHFLAEMKIVFSLLISAQQKIAFTLYHLQGKNSHFLPILLHCEI